MDYQIKQLNSKDFEKFYTFAHDFVLNQFLDYPPVVRRKWFSIEFKKKELLEKLKEEKLIVLLAYDKDAIIGFSMIFLEDGGALYLSWLCVDEQYRGKGIGSSFLKRIETIALDNKRHFIYLSTENLRNIEYYKKRGFYLVGLRKEAWFGMDEYAMQKNLCTPFKEIFEE
jgi:ribosomal protein S18 acetylase RimI-like enzyme